MRKAYAWVVLISIVFSAVSVAAEDQQNAKETEVKRLMVLLNAEKDPTVRETLNREISQLGHDLDEHAVVELHDDWIRETDPEKKKDIGDRLAEVAVHLKNFAEDEDNEAAQRALEIIIEVATNRTFHQKEIKISGEPKTIPLRLIKSFNPERAQWSGTAAWVVRRMTNDRCEVWLPHHGWLFDNNGRLINEALPPRRDGVGRQWYGAFLPDGRWVTTDLWDTDRTLHFFSRGGKWLKDIPADKLVPAGENEDRWSPPTIGWCRSTRNGDEFVVHIGQNGGRGAAVVNWSGQHRVLRDENDPWKLCYRRDLEPKGMYTILSVPDDQGKLTMSRQEDSHGTYVGYPVYEAGKISARIPDGEAFGFWPDSDNGYIVTETTAWSRGSEGESKEGPKTVRTWFYSADGTFDGWIDGARLADTASLDGMLFVDSANRVITLNKNYQISSIDQFIWPDKTTAKPQKIFPDIRLGLFIRDDTLVLAAW